MSTDDWGAELVDLNLYRELREQILGPPCVQLPIPELAYLGDGKPPTPPPTPRRPSRPLRPPIPLRPA